MRNGSRREWAIDGGIAVGFSAIALVTVLTGLDDGYRGTAPVAVSAAVAGIAPLGLVLRRRRPVLALALVVALRGLPQLVADIDRPFFGGLIVVAVGLAACAQHARRPGPLLAWLLPASLYALYATLDPRFRAPSEWVFELAVFALAWGIGGVLRLLTARNRALEDELAAVARAEALRRATRLSLERERIARDLHDAIAGNVTAMVATAATARVLIDSEPAASAAALHEVEAGGRLALAELRRALGLLRADGDPPVEARG